VYEVVVSGCVERTLHATLEDLEVSWSAVPGTHTMSVVDQSQLVAVIARLNDVGIVIEQVRRF
jgi:hypothetical protein